ncbi:MAG: threonine aldolase [Flavobacteriales bacterium]|nr:threonine aldolase [Flavobacteriales bacterium]|tara:strand:- start:13280 stop:14305 length:1026 start_codon:yes stop_codon:yes gene_type:complete
MKKIQIDLRSDTITLPTPEMLKYMFNAKVGDDVWEEDETVKALENQLASIFGKESALFCPSGTMTNQIAIRLHTQIGDELVCDKLSHIYNYEGGGIASNSGVSARLLSGECGRITVDQIHQNINPDDVHFPRTSLVCLENTVNKGGGVCYDYSQIQDISTYCHSNSLALHLDGARIFNALIAKNDSAKNYGKLFDSISVCLSKGLGAPVGSVLIGDLNFIKNAKRVRKSLGGGMRQVGYLAAAGQYALDNHITRLSDDHDRAKKIGDKLNTLSIVNNLRPVETNIVLFDVHESHLNRFKKLLNNYCIKASFMGDQTVRFVTHLDFCDKKLSIVLNALEELN